MSAVQLLTCVSQSMPGFPVHAFQCDESCAVAGIVAAASTILPTRPRMVIDIRKGSSTFQPANTRQVKSWQSPRDRGDFAAKINDCSRNIGYSRHDVIWSTSLFNHGRIGGYRRGTRSRVCAPWPYRGLGSTEEGAT